MYHFMKLLESAREHGVGFMSKHRAGLLDRRPPADGDWAALEKCQPFVFTVPDKIVGLKVDVKDELISKRTDQISDAPFPVFSVEMLGDNEILGVMTNGGITLDAHGNETRQPIYIHCLVAIEVRPTEFVYFMSARTDASHLSVVMPSAHLVRPLLDQFLNRLSKEKLGLQSVRATVRIGSGKSKRIHRIRRVIHVAPKKYVKKQDVKGSNVNWTHRFEVRGHWRVLDGLGKDREGNYCVSGFTWVTHHTRGPEDLPLVKKVRVIDVATANPNSTSETTPNE